jgi:hypothetical protein
MRCGGAECRCVEMSHVDCSGRASVGVGRTGSGVSRRNLGCMQTPLPPSCHLSSSLVGSSAWYRMYRCWLGHHVRLKGTSDRLGFGLAAKKKSEQTERGLNLGPTSPTQIEFSQSPVDQASRSHCDHVPTPQIALTFTTQSSAIMAVFGDTIFLSPCVQLKERVMLAPGQDIV